jgi:AraC-like DNA-binding protein
MLFTSAFLVLVISSILLINHWSQNKGIVYLTFTIILFSLRQITFLLINSDVHIELLSILLIHFDPLSLLIGPCLLYYLKSLVHGKLVVDKYLLICAIPALIVLINTIPYYSYPFAEKVAHFTQVQETVNLLGPSDFPYLLFPFRYQGLGGTLFNLIFVLYSIAYVVQLRKNSTNYIKKKLSVLLHHISVVIPLVIIPNWILLAYTLVTIPKTGILSLRQPAFEPDGVVFLVSLLLPLSFFLIPSWLYNEKEPFSFLDNFRAAWKKMILSNSMTSQKSSFGKSSDFERIISYIETEKPYLQKDFFLHDISQALDIPRIRVTTCFNKELNTPFPSYRNKLRVAHAISLLRAGAHLTTSIEGIAERSGFKSKSIFYAAFKEEYGVTPTDWIKKHL